MKEQQTSRWAGVITNIQSNVLENLGHYGYLTMSQMLALEVGTKYYQYLWKQVKSIRDRNKPLVRCNNFKAPQPRKGKVESIYFLTKYGKRTLVNDLQISENVIKMPIGSNIAYKDYFHRRYTIDFQITLDHWANANGFSIPFFDTYFDKTGDNRIKGNLRAKTRIDFGGRDYFIPDGAFKVVIEDEQHFYLFEMYNGKDTGRTLKQIHKHATALVKRFTHTAYSLNPKKAYRIVLLFESDSLKRAIIRRVQEQSTVFHQVQKYFLLKSREELTAGDFYNNWATLLGESRDFL